ncbi:MAG: V-type ATPase subunit [Pseudomonadota bacterium]
MSQGFSPYLRTRVAIMASRLLGVESLQALVDKPLPVLGATFGFQGFLEETLPAEAKNQALERALIQTFMAELTILLRPLVGEGRDVLLYWAQRYELLNIKTLIRGKLRGSSQQAIEQTLFDLPWAMSVTTARLLKAENVLELLRQLEQGRYAMIARQARQAFEEKQETFAMEAAIDHRFFSGLAKQVHVFATEGPHEDLKRLVGTLLDHQNLMWLLRYRFAYQVPPAEAYYLLTPSWLLMNRETLMRLVNLGTFPQVIASLPKALADLLAEAQTAMAVQKRLHARLHALAWKILRHSASDVARTMAYLILRESELHQLFALIQGKIFGLPVDLIRDALELMPDGVTVRSG